MAEGEIDAALLNVTPEGVAMITLNRPEVHNALNGALVQRLTEIFDDLADQDGVRVVLIDGAGASFSAGADLAEMRAGVDNSDGENRAESEQFAEMLSKLRAMPQPTVALVHGAAIAGGLGLAAACDIAIATKDAKFAISEVRLGLVPAVVSPYIVEAMGPRAARRYTLTGERFSADTAAQLGLVHILVEDQNALSTEAERITGELLQGSPGALSAAKELLDLVTYMPIDEDLVEETVNILVERRGTEEAKEGVAAFLDKRKAGWVS